MEVMAEGYLKELISRNMIQAAELTKVNEVKSYRIHDIVRETILSKSKEECFSTTIIGLQGMGNEKARRISIYHNRSTGENNDSMDSRCSKIRSLMVFQFDETPRSFQATFFNAFRLLRVLDLEGADLIEFPAELIELIHLRYLSLRRTKITMLPKSIGNLKNLETLDLKETSVSELRVEIFKLQRLRHLLVYRHLHVYRSKGMPLLSGVSVPTGRIGNLTCLQKLSYLDFQHQAACDSGVLLKELGKLTKLRKLGIMNLKGKDGIDLCLALEKMKDLDSLDIERSLTEVDHEEGFLELKSSVSPPQFLRHLYLNGRLRKLPDWMANNSFGNLVALRLKYSRLSGKEDEPLKAFQHLPNLEVLHLFGAYDGEELCTEVGGYHKLKDLLLRQMKRLKRVSFAEGSLPVLKELEIEDCPVLEMVPLGIQHLSGLETLYLSRVHPELVKRIRKVQGEAQGDGDDCWKVQHISTIKHFYWTQGDLVYENLSYMHMKISSENVKDSAPSHQLYDLLQWRS